MSLVSGHLLLRSSTASGATTRASFKPGLVFGGHPGGSSEEPGTFDLRLGGGLVPGAQLHVTVDAGLGPLPITASLSNAGTFGASPRTRLR